MKYFTKDSATFLKNLEQNNNSLWFRENKQKYIELIKGPMISLTEKLEKKYGPAHIFRPNRDVRFTKDKSLYKTFASFAFSHANIASLYVEFKKDGMMLTGGIYGPEKDQLERWRNIFAEESQNLKTKDMKIENINTIKNFLAKAKKSGFTLREESSLKSAPRGYSKDNPEIFFINLRHMALNKNYDIADWMFSEDLWKHLAKDMRILEEWDEIITKYVGITSIQRMSFHK